MSLQGQVAWNIHLGVWYVPSKALFDPKIRAHVKTKSSIATS